jgi:hypothetical protein
MSRRSQFVMLVAIAATSGAAALVTGQVGGQGSQMALPSGQPQQKAQKACLACHDAKIIWQQQLDKKVWTKEVDKMIRWGAAVAPEDRDALIDYFAQNFGPRDLDAAAMLPPGPGKEKVVETCFECHDARSIVQKQLSEAGWERIVERMEDFGAYVYDDDREDIIRYLAKAFPPAQPQAPAKQR